LRQARIDLLAVAHALRYSVLHAVRPDDLNTLFACMRHRSVRHVSDMVLVDGRLRRQRLVSSFTSSYSRRLILLVFPVCAFVTNRVRTACIWCTRTNPPGRPLTVTSDVSLTATSRATILGRSLAVTRVVMLGQRALSAKTYTCLTERRR
jgi:hypothetical protein